ncbi:MAG: winged helix-turn-helix domain-containing protein [Casimicrobiaceae bacterium]
MPGLYAFDRCEIRPGERQLLIDGAPAALGARAFDLLLALIERRERVVDKAELFDAVWPGLVVEENNLQVQVSSLRKLLGPAAIATVPGRGYQFVAPLESQVPGVAVSAPRTRAHPNNLLPPRTRFIGREKALADCANLLRETRLLTLSGIGGCGKTRLAQELAQRQLDAYPDGVWFVDLGPLQEARRVSTTVAATLGFRDESDASLGELAGHLKAQRTLIVLDNCEHVIDAAVESIETLLANCAALKVVATSREALGVAGEQVFAVRSLSLPATTELDDIRRSEAVRLFVDHARLVLPDFDVDERNAVAIVEICRRLDGIALAIELAAARIRVLSVDDIHARLDDRFRLLTGGNRALPRHQTLQATMEWSHDHLSGAERRMFRRLAVFAGGCTLGAAAQVAGGSADEFETLECLTALHDKSLLMVDRDTAARPRYRMLETVRQYAENRLNEAGEGSEVRTRHLLHFVALAEGVAETLKGPHPDVAYAILRPEAENLLAALAWAPHAPQGGELALRLIGSAWMYWKSTSEAERGYHLAQAALDLAGDGPDATPRFNTLQALAKFALVTGRYDVIHVCAEHCLAMARRMNDPYLIASAIEMGGIGHLVTGNTAQAMANFSQCCDIARSTNDEARLARALHNLAEIHRGAGSFVEAETLYREALAICRARDESKGCIGTLLSLGMLFVATGRAAEARAAFAESAVMERKTGDTSHAALTLDSAATLASFEGDHAEAARLHGAALARMRDARSKHEPVDVAFIAPRIASSRAAIGEAAFDRAEAEGMSSSYDASLAEMMTWLVRDAAKATTPAARSRRAARVH